jgi:anaerobic ribonucleoside-triphosphate reductase activating protein
MLRLASYDIVFQEIPGETTLALNLSGCPNRCPGCHSPHLQREGGEVLDEPLLEGLLERYGAGVTCVCWMGGDGAPQQLVGQAAWVRQRGLKTAWYSGREDFPPAYFDYVKLGPYIESLGGLDSPTTNQRLYRQAEGRWEDITHLFTMPRNR